MDGLHCDGTESTLLGCRFNGFGNEDCSHSEDAGVTCCEEVLKMRSCLCLSFSLSMSLSLPPPPSPNHPHAPTHTFHA